MGAAPRADCSGQPAALAGDGAPAVAQVSKDGDERRDIVEPDAPTAEFFARCLVCWQCRVPEAPSALIEHFLSFERLEPDAVAATLLSVAAAFCYVAALCNAVCGRVLEEFGGGYESGEISPDASETGSLLRLAGPEGARFRCCEPKTIGWPGM